MDRKLIPPRDGLLHIVDAAGYSLAGVKRLWAETAARLEVLGACVE
jgi:diacylglycerol kinase (ATP)